MPSASLSESDVGGNEMMNLVKCDTVIIAVYMGQLLFFPITFKL